MTHIRRIDAILDYAGCLLPLVVAFFSWFGVQFFFEAAAGFSWLWIANAVAAAWIALHATRSKRDWPTASNILGVFVGFLLVSTPTVGLSLDGLFMSAINTLEVGIVAKLMITLLRAIEVEREAKRIGTAFRAYALSVAAVLALIALCAGSYFSMQYGAQLIAASIDWWLSNAIAYSAITLLLASFASHSEDIRPVDWLVLAAITIAFVFFHDFDDELTDMMLDALLIVLAASYLNLKLVGWAIISVVAVDFYGHVGQMDSGSHVQYIAMVSLYVALSLYIAVNRHISEMVNSDLRLNQERQRELFAVVGHELRTPVASIDMVVKDGDLSAEDKVRTIEEITLNLLSVLEDMRTVVAPERAKESREVYANPSDVIQRAASPLTQLLREKGLSLELKVPQSDGARYFFSDQALRQLVTNLVKNAAIHSQGNLVRISFCLNALNESDDADVAILSVEDNGRGIPEGLIGRMFEAFRRGATKANGSGLGLYIAQGLAEELGGIIEYETSDLGGACFKVRFSLTREHTAQQAQAQAQAQAQCITLNGLRILLAEDELMLRMLSEKMLCKLGAHVTSFDNGQSALNAFDPNKFDLILTDLMMPQMDGYSLTAAIRATGASTPILAVTAAVVGDETDEVMRAGADGYISKPISPEKVIDAMNKIVFSGAPELNQIEQNGVQGSLVAR